MNFHPNKSVGCGVTLSVKKISVTFVTCVRIRASHYDERSQNFGSLGGWVISILTLQMIWFQQKWEESWKWLKIWEIVRRMTVEMASYLNLGVLRVDLRHINYVPWIFSIHFQIRIYNIASMFRTVWHCNQIICIKQMKHCTKWGFAF